MMQNRLLASGWVGSALAIALLVAVPVLFVFGSVFTDSGEVWAHLVSTVLWRYVRNSLWLAVGVGMGTAAIGVGTAWLVTACQFRGSRMLAWVLLLPFAIPTYLLAYTYTEVLDVGGSVQTWLRLSFDWDYGEYWFPDIRSLWGAIALLIFTLYPYVYLLARAAFLEQSGCTLEASRVLGCNPWRGFFTVALPLARPAIAAGLSLVLMETLNDFGTVQHFGVDTFTTGIYRTWFSMGDRVAAAKLAAFLMLFVLWLVLLERRSRQQAQYYRSATAHRTVTPFVLTGWRAWGAQVFCWLPVMVGFLVPAGILLYMTLMSWATTFGDRFWSLATNSLILALTAAALGAVVATVIAYGVRLQGTGSMRFAARIASMGYAVPGSVIAVGVLIPMGRLDNAIDAWMRATFGISTGLLLSGTAIALVYAYLVRFLSVAFGTVESGLGNIHPHLDDASRSLGRSPTGTLVRVHAPLMWSSLLTAALLVFVDVMKELPATLVIRPFDFDTLAVRVYQLASDERLTEAAGPALAIVLVGLIPVGILSWQIRRSR